MPAVNTTNTWTETSEKKRIISYYPQLETSLIFFYSRLEQLKQILKPNHIMCKIPESPGDKFDIQNVSCLS